MSIKATTRTELPPIDWYDPTPQPVVIEHEGESAWAMWDSAWAQLDQQEQTCTT